MNNRIKAKMSRTNTFTNDFYMEGMNFGTVLIKNTGNRFETRTKINHNFNERHSLMKITALICDIKTPRVIQSKAFGFV